MGFGKLLVVIALCFSINALLCVGRKKKKPSTDALYECLKTQACKCNKPERFSDCYGHMTEKSQVWAVDQLNKCNLIEFEYGKINEGLQNICLTDDKEFKACYDHSLEDFKKRYGEVSMGMHGPDESPAFEKGRGCLEAIAAFCESSPDECISTG